MNAPMKQIKKASGSASSNLMKANLNEIGKVAQWMCAPRHPWRIPRFIPAPCAPTHSFGENAIKLTPNQMAEGFLTAFRVTPSIEFPVQQLTKLSNQYGLKNPIETDISHIFTANDDPIWIDKTLALTNGSFVKAASNTSLAGRHFSESTGTTGSMKDGGKCYHIKPVLSASSGSIYIKNSDSQQMTCSLICVALDSEYKMLYSWETTDLNVGANSTTNVVYCSTTGTDQGGASQTYANFVTTVATGVNNLTVFGWAMGVRIRNFSTIGRVPPGMQITLSQPFEVAPSYAWTEYPIFNDKAMQQTRIAVRQGAAYSHTACDVILREHETICDGQAYSIQVPWEEEQNVPGTPEGLINYINASNNPDKCKDDFKKGVHIHWKPYKLEDLQWKVAQPSTPFDYETMKTSCMYFVMEVAPAVNTGVVIPIEFHIATELQTQAQLLDVEQSPTDSFSLFALLIALRTQDNSCSCNPNHLAKVKNFVKKVVTNPEVIDIARRLASAGIKYAGPALLGMI